VIIAFAANLVTDPYLSIEAVLPAWLNITGLSNEIDFGDSNIRAIEITISVRSSLSVNTFTFLPVELRDRSDPEFKESKTYRIAVNRTLSADITYPPDDALVRGDVPIFGFASGKGFKEYRLKFGGGVNPTNFVLITNGESPQEFDNLNRELLRIGTNRDRGGVEGNLGTWEAGLSPRLTSRKWKHNLNGVYTVRLEVVHSNGNIVVDDAVLQVGRVIEQGAGASVPSADGNAILSVPEFAIPSAGDIAAVSLVPDRFLRRVEQTNLNFIGKIYEVRAPGSRFSETARLEISYTEDDLDLNQDSIPDVNENDLRIYAFNTLLSKWTRVGGIVDVTNNVVEAEISVVMPFFAFYSIVHDPSSISAPTLDAIGGSVSYRDIRIFGFGEPTTIIKLFINEVERTSTIANAFSGRFESSLSLDLGTNLITAVSRDSRGSDSVESDPVSVVYQPHPPSSVFSLTFMNSNFTEIDNRTQVRTGDDLFIQLTGIDTSSNSVDEAEIRITSSILDTNGIDIFVDETSSNSGVFQGIIFLSTNSSATLHLLKAGSQGETITAASKDDPSKFDQVAILDDLAPRAPNVRSPSHPSVVQDTFETGVEHWKSQGGDRSAVTRTDALTFASGRFSFNISKLGRGSVLAISLNDVPYQAEEFQIVKFDYKIPPTVKVDLVVKVFDKLLAIRLTDAIKHVPATGFETVGAVPVTADSEWRSLEFNLFEILKTRFQKRRAFTIEKLFLADVPDVSSQNNSDLFASFNIDNFIISKPQPETRPLLFWENPSDGSGISDYSYVVNQIKNTVPDTVGEGLTNRALFGPLSNGEYYFHIRAKDGAENWGDTESYFFEIDTRGPQASNPFPQRLAFAAPDSVSLILSDNTGSGIDVGSVVFRVNEQLFRIREDELEYFPGTEILKLSFSQETGLIFTNGQTVLCKLPVARDLSGNDLRSVLRWQWTYTFTNDRSPPTAPEIVFPRRAVLSSNSINFRWMAYDPSGIEGFSFILDQIPATFPDTNSEGTFTNLQTNLADGRYYFHVRARDKAGNWGPVTHKVIFVNVARTGEDLFVDNELGSDKNDGLSPETAFGSIKRALNDIRDGIGGRIFVRATPLAYTNSAQSVVAVRKSGKSRTTPLELIGYTTDTNVAPLISGRDTSQYGFSLLDVQNVTIANFHVRSSRNSGVSLRLSDFCVVKQVRSVANGLSGIQLVTSRSNLVYSNEIISNLQSGLEVNDFSEGNFFHLNEVSRNLAQGILLSKSSRNNLILSNSVHHNPSGIVLQTSAIKNEVVQNKIFSNASTGILVHLGANLNMIASNDVNQNRSTGILLDDTLGNQVIGNNCSNNLGTGIFVRKSEESLISNNVVTGPFQLTGIRLSRGIENIISGNNVHRNISTGILLENSSLNNRIINNLVSSNAGVGMRFLRKSAGNEVISNRLVRNGSVNLSLDRAPNNRFLFNTILESISAGGIESVRSKGTLFERNWVARNKGSGISLTRGGSNSKLSRNIIVSNNGNGIFIGPNSDNTEIVSNLVSDSLFNSLDATGSFDLNIVGNVLIKSEQLSGARFFNCDGLNFKNNLVSANGAFGLRLKSCAEARVVSNRVTRNKQDGISVTGGEGQHLVEDNVVLSNKRIGITFLGVVGNNNNNVVRANEIHDNQNIGFLIRQSSNNIVQKNRISGSAVSDGLVFQGVRHSTIVSNEIFGNAHHGIVLEGPRSTNNLITGNFVYSNFDRGLFLVRGAKGNRIIGNTISENAKGGITVLRSARNRIQSNICSGNILSGIEVVNGRFTVVEDNQSHGPRQGKGILIDNSAFNQVRRNLASSNLLTGIQIKRSRSGTIVVSNIIIRNGREGVRIQRSSGVHLSHNRILRNTIFGISLLGAKNNLIAHNRIIGPRQKEGISLQNDSIGNTLLANTVIRNVIGIDIVESSGNDVYKNLVLRNRVTGIRVKNSPATIIRNSTIYSNKNGIKIQGRANNIFLENLIISGNTNFGLIRVP